MKADKSDLKKLQDDLAKLAKNLGELRESLNRYKEKFDKPDLTEQLIKQINELEKKFNDFANRTKERQHTFEKELQTANNEIADLKS